MLEKFIIGKIINTHGVKGELKVAPETDDLERFSKLKKVQVLNKGTVIEYKVIATRYMNKYALLTFEGVDTIEKAELLKGALLQILRVDSVKLAEDHFFIGDLIGCEVFEMDGNRLGTIRDVIPTGSNDVYEVIDEKGRAILIPALKAVVKEVDIEGAKIKVDLMPGLKEIYYEN